MTRMTGPDCVVMCNLINTYIHTYIHTYYIHIQSPNVSKIGALQPLEEIEETVQITSNGWRAGITLDNFWGGLEVVGRW